MSRLSTIEASIIINCIWRLWCATLLWSIGDSILHRNIAGLLLALSWCLMLLLLLLYMLWLLVAVDQTGLTFVALLWVSLLRSSVDTRVIPLLVLHLTTLVLYNQGLVH